MAKKLDFDVVLQALADERHIKADEVQARVLERKVWLMMYSAPGCLPDHRDISLTKADAIDGAVLLYGDDAPRGFKTALQRHGIAPTDANGYYRVEVTQVSISDLL